MMPYAYHITDAYINFSPYFNKYIINLMSFQFREIFLVQVEDPRSDRENVPKI